MIANFTIGCKAFKLIHLIYLYDPNISEHI